MKKPMLLKICLSGPSSKTAPDEVYKAIQDSPKIEECYRLDGTKVTAAAIEFIAILTAIGAIAEIASFLYQIWKDHKEKGNLYVTINPGEGVQILISEDTSEIEIREFQRKIIAELKKDELNSMDKELLCEIKETHYWIKTK